jgi:predicted glycosyltransferase
MLDFAEGHRSPRIALYSHDTMGLGHFRRNLLLAQAFTAAPLGASVLMLSGMREAGRFALPAGADLVTLPGWRKDADGRYAPRDLPGEAGDLASLRGAVIRAALDGFAPDLFIVDNAPRGAEGELAPVLKALRRRGGTRCVLGLRDILDDPATVRRQWWRTRCYEAAGAWFDAIWVYGDRRICRTDAEYGFGPDLAPRLRHLGYPDPRGRLALSAEQAPVAGRYVLCAAGGGQDGAALTEAFAAADMPAGLQGVILLGSMAPDATRARVRALASRRAGMTVLDESPEAMALIAGAERVVAMGGYNTTLEALSLRKPTLLVPRVRPRREQAIRAERLAALGLVDVLHPGTGTSAAIADWLARPVAPAPNTLDFGGLDRAVAEAAALIAAPAARPRPKPSSFDLFEVEVA